MIISHKYKFIFIKTKKTAGTSIELYLSQICGDNDVVTPINPQIEPHSPRNFRGIWNPTPEIFHNDRQPFLRTCKHLLTAKKFYNHMPGPLVRNRVTEDVWNDYFKFCVDRNPWDKTISHYHMIKARKDERLSFDDYLRRGNFCLNYPFYTDPDDSLIVDKVIRYESLAEDFTTALASLGIPIIGNLERAKGEYRQDKRPYQSVYSDRQREIIEKVFSTEIRLHGYQF